MNDSSLEKPSVLYQFEDKHINREWQGIPGIEKTKSGRFFATWYSGGVGECSKNFVILAVSENGEEWKAPYLVVQPIKDVRAFDPCVWIDPQNALHLFWAQSYGLFDGRVGVWEIICADPDADELTFSEPRRLADGIMMNKPTVLSSGEWLYPISVWAMQPRFDREKNLPDATEVKNKKANVYMSVDNGKTLKYMGGADVEGRVFDEHMLVEKQDKSLWVLVRTHDIGESISYDKGITWQNGASDVIKGPGSRFFIRRLPSGNLLLINHYKFERRNNMTARLSYDDGKTWEHELMLDERSNVSYPDGVIDGDDIYIVYDRERYGAKEILYARFTEQDIKDGEFNSELSFKKKIINKI